MVRCHYLGLENEKWQEGEEARIKVFQCAVKLRSNMASAPIEALQLWLGSPARVAVDVGRRHCHLAMLTLSLLCIITSSLFPNVIF